MEKVVCEHTTSRTPVFRRSCETSVLSVWRVAERANKKKKEREKERAKRIIEPHFPHYNSIVVLTRKSHRYMVVVNSITRTHTSARTRTHAYLPLVARIALHISIHGCP